MKRNGLGKHLSWARDMPTRRALNLSVSIILLVWLQKVIRNTYFLAGIKALFESLPRVFVQATVSGMLTIAVVSLLLYLSKEGYESIGFSRQNLVRQLLTGFLFGVLIFSVDTFAVSPAVDALLPKTATTGVDLAKFFANTYYLPIWIAVSLFKGGFSEELWRIFTLTRFEMLLGRWGLGLALVVGSLIFGIGHLYQGTSGMVSTAIVGLLYGLVYLRKRRAFEAVTAHAAYDLIATTLGFILYSR